MIFSGILHNPVFLPAKYGSEAALLSSVRAALADDGAPKAFASRRPTHLIAVRTVTR